MKYIFPVVVADVALFTLIIPNAIIFPGFFFLTYVALMWIGQVLREERR